jgi:kojibiose phosphorylase
MALRHDLRAAGTKVAVGSASKNARAVVAKLELGDETDAISDGHSVDRQKPAPDLSLRAGSQLGVHPSHCVVVEDAESGIEAALASGAWAVDLGPAARVGAAHVILPSLENVRWRDLLALLARQRAQGSRGKRAVSGLRTRTDRRPPHRADASRGSAHTRPSGR